jgi:hypothetical protein
MAVQRQKWTDYNVEKATAENKDDFAVASRLDSKKGVEERKKAEGRSGGVQKTKMSSKEKVQKIQSLMDENLRGYEVKLWEKNNMSRAYISKNNGRRVNDYGYIDLKTLSVDRVRGDAQRWASTAIKESGLSSNG